VAALLLHPDAANGHAVAGGDKGFIQCSAGVMLAPFLYLGAKHMVTGYDHLLFLTGVIFFLYRARDVALYVTLFAVGHSVTLLFGVLTGLGVDAHLIDAIIGLSIAYKALDNIGALRRLLGFQPDARAATMFFGLCHGLGLASRIIDFEVSRNGLVPNLIAFNVGVEVGQLLALGAILVAMGYWRRSSGFTRNAFAANVALLVSGLALASYQAISYFRSAT
jgi:hypothetical protein